MIPLILIIVSLIAAGVFCLLWIFVRRMDRKDVDVVLDAIDDTRDQVDAHQVHTSLEHKNINDQLRRVIGMMQFQLSDKIWAEKEIIKQARAEAMAAEVKKLAEEPNNDG